MKKIAILLAIIVIVGCSSEYVRDNNLIEFEVSSYVTGVELTVANEECYNYVLLHNGTDEILTSFTVSLNGDIFVYAHSMLPNEAYLLCEWNDFPGITGKIPVVLIEVSIYQ